MKKLTLAVDLDNTIVDSRGIAEDWLIECRFGKLSPLDFKEAKSELAYTSFEEFFGISHGEVVKMLKDPEVLGRFSSVKLIPGFLENVYVLARIFDLVCVTARSNEDYLFLKKMLKERVPNAFKEVYCMDYCLEGKVPFCTGNNFFGLIDDDPKNFLGIEKTNLHGILYANPRNENYRFSSNPKRIDNWDDIQVYLRSLI